MVLDVVAGLQEVHKQETSPSEVTAVFLSIQEPQVDHVANSVQNNQHKIANHIHQMQAMIQSVQIQYAAPQPSYQYYGGHSHYIGNNGFRDRGRRGLQHL